MEKKGVWRESLQMQTNKILYVRGNSSSVPFINLYHAILERRRKNTYAAVGIWTIDKYSSMKRYLEAGVDLILTNMPSLLAVDLIGHNLSLHHIYARKCFYCQITYSESGGRFFFGGGGNCIAVIIAFWLEVAPLLKYHHLINLCCAETGKLLYPSIVWSIRTHRALGLVCLSTRLSSPSGHRFLDPGWV